MKRSGFSLLELSVVLGVIALVIGMSLTVGKKQVDQQRVSNSFSELQVIKEALFAYGRRHGKLPCPSPLNVAVDDANYGFPAPDCDATPTAGVTHTATPATKSGAVPFKVLGLSDAFIADDWDKRYVYAVSDLFITSMGQSSTGVITVNDFGGNVITDEAAFVLYTHGETALGATDHETLAVVACSGTQLDRENCSGTDGTYIDSPIRETNTDATFYDDMLLWANRESIFSSTAAIVPVTPKPPADIATCSLPMLQHSSCGLNGDGRAFCWGAGPYGELGQAGDSNDSVPGLTFNGEGPGLYTKLVGRSNQICGFATDGNIYCWGRGSNYRLGNNDTSDQDEPSQLHNGASPGGFTQIAVGGGHGCGIASDGETYCWGESNRGQVGDGGTTDRPEPVLISAGENSGSAYVQIATGSEHSCGIRADGVAFCWGNAWPGRLGDGSGSGIKTTAVQVHAGENTAGTFAQIAPSHNFSCGLGTDSKAYCWGRNNYGQLGDGTSSNSDEPVEVHAGEGPGTYTRIGIGDNAHACAIGTDSKVYCWGRNNHGQLGDGTTTDRDEPVEVHAGAGPGTYESLGAGEVHTCGVATDGKTYCWGEGDTNQLGYNSSVDVSEPVEVLTGEGYSAAPCS